jgi:hypothetical protein
LVLRNDKVRERERERERERDVLANDGERLYINRALSLSKNAIGSRRFHGDKERRNSKCNTEEGDKKKTNTIAFFLTRERERERERV